MRLILSLLALCVASAFADLVRYDNFQVHKVVPKTVAQVEALRELQDGYAGFNFWNEVRGVNIPVFIMVAPHLRNNFKDMISLQNLNDEVTIENVQELVERTYTKSSTKAFGWTQYYRYADVWTLSIDSFFYLFSNVIITF